MNKKILSIILGLALIAGFFLPLTSAGSGSAFDLVQAKYSVSGAEAIIAKYIWILFPVCGLLLVIGALNNNTWVPARAIWAILPLLAILYLVVKPVIDGADIGAMIKVFGIGYWITVAASLVLAVWHPKK